MTDYHPCEICGNLILGGHKCPVCALAKRVEALEKYTDKPADWSPLESERQSLGGRVRQLASRLSGHEIDLGGVESRLATAEKQLALLGQPAPEVHGAERGGRR